MWKSIPERLVKIAKLDTNIYHEIVSDPKATREALILVVISSALAALGRAWGGGALGVHWLMWLASGIVVNWLLWTLITQWVGSRIYGGGARFWDMARVLGYANVTRAFGVVTVLPCVGPLVGHLGLALTLVIGFIAIREISGLTSEQTLISVLVGDLGVIVANIVLAIIL